jgi:hypothetical protein
MVREGTTHAACNLRRRRIRNCTSREWDPSSRSDWSIAPTPPTRRPGVRMRRTRSSTRYIGLQAKGGNYADRQ